MALVRDNIGPLSIFLRDKALLCADAPDVVLLQGFATGPRCMRPVADHLRRSGHQPAVAPIGGLFGHLQTCSVARAAKRLDKYLAQLPPGTRPWLVGHSIGGIIARVAIQNGEARHHISGLITLAAPHQGCPAAVAGLLLGIGLISTAPWSITPISPTIRKLNKTPWPRSVPFISIASTKDLLCRPKHSRIPFADDRLIRNIVIDHHGHTAMLRSSHVLNAIQDIVSERQAA